MKFLKAFFVFFLCSIILFNDFVFAYPVVNTTDPEETESNTSVIPNLTLEEQTVSDNITHTIHWDKSIKDFDVEIYNRVTFRYKDITTLSSNDLGKIATFGDLQKTIADLPWSYETLDLAKITDDGISSNWGEYSVNFSNILQAYVDNSTMSVEDARSPFWKIYQFYANQIIPLEIKDLMKLDIGFDFEKAYNNQANYENNAYYFLQSIPYGEKKGCLVQYDRVEYFVRFVRTKSEQFSINDLQPSEDGRYHYKFSGEWVYTNNSPNPLINGWYDISFSQPVALFVDGGQEGYTWNGLIKTPLFQFNPQILYKSPTKLYGDNLVIGDSEMNFVPKSIMNRDNINYDKVSSWTITYGDINLNSITTPLTVTGRYINAVREPNLKGKVNITYNEYRSYEDSSKDNIYGSTTKDLSFNSYFLSLTNPWETGFFANSELPAFKTQADLTDYFNGKTYDKLIQEYTPCYPVLKSWNDDSEYVVNKPSSTTVNYINYDTNIDDILDEKDNENDDEYIRLLKKLNNTDKKILAVLKGIGTFDDFYSKLKPLLDNISGTINNLDSTLSNIYDYLKNLTFDTSSDDKPDLTNIETLLTNILNAIDIPDYNETLTDILNAIDIPDYNSKLQDIINAIDIPDYSETLTDILNAINFNDIVSGLTDIKDEVSSAAQSIIDALDSVEINVKNVIKNDTDNNFLLLYNALKDDYGVDLETKFPFCFVFAIVTLCGALIADPQVPTINIPNNINAFGYDLDLGINQSFNFLNASVPVGSFAISFNDIVSVIRLIILFIFIYNFGLLVFNTIHRTE